MPVAIVNRPHDPPEEPWTGLTPSRAVRIANAAQVAEHALAGLQRALAVSGYCRAAELVGYRAEALLEMEPIRASMKAVLGKRSV